MLGKFSWLGRMFPALRWWPRVDREVLRTDLAAGAVGAIVVLPQAIAFATLAGLPPQYGLYAAMVPAVIAALWGSSWHLVSGPTNAISLVVFATMTQLAEPGSAKYINLVLMLTFLVGATQLVAGLARLGVLVNFISHTVVVGFTAGAALLIIASQLRNFFGVPVPAGTSFFETLHAFGAGADEIQTTTLLVGVITLAAGIAARRWLPRVPYMIVAMLAGALAGYAINRWHPLGGISIRVLGALPAALPAFSVPQFSFDTMRALGSAALAVSLLGLVEAVSIARSIALKSGQRIDGNQEFIGQGLSNLAGSFFSAYPSSGSFNRSGANYEAGAQTPLAAVLSAALLVLIVLAVAPLAAFIPVASMAAILLLVAWGLFDFHQMRTIVRASRAEGALLAVTVFATLTLHLEIAILFGIALSLVLYLHRTSRPALRSILPDPQSAQRKFRERRPGEAECPQLRILRVEGSLYFGAVSHVGDYLQQIEERRPLQRHLLLLSKSMNFVDVAGAELLAGEARRRRARGGGLYFHGLRDAAARMLFGPAFRGEFAPGAKLATKREAVAVIFARLDRNVCASCRARVFEECASLPPPGDGASVAPRETR
ncbi:MAG: sodium-independent anion transporter [Betaproteobacteria bacterium RIFCSPLOWO2_02_67_12]|nr:MAG: sodium-independent anion transporter [Betaproteobacteria bacterium RIFCSPLOWO2_02_67_12]OGA27244.1 MAG: sodium-independent anion transporter [Betaproteobacteria bacterium RIFCSPLOWO2_02_FULL_68_150]OGA69614.1 MAG: sodium-independent anion transporter [Betaproteobacteria bacterium RIFCSPLOWO2_12_FULL_67_28]